ncbi:MAG TPA: ribosome maturation factor RimM [Alphaproteobacteria bacterium]
MPKGPASGLAASREHVCVGAVAAAHGIKGEVKIKAFTADPASVGAYGPLLDETGKRSFKLSAVRVTNDGTVIARLDGVADRNAAEALRGLRFYALRAALPEAGEGEYYHHDLIGLKAVLASGEDFGTVVAVDNFGAGDVIEIKPANGDSVVLPFTDAVVPEVDLSAGRIVVAPPDGLLDDEEPQGDRS